jgi:aspartate ammonia-lyase
MVLHPSLKRHIINIRTEHDLLGDQSVPADALYGGQTARAVEKFPITLITINH